MARYVVDQDGLWWAGVTLLLLSCAATGAGLVSSSAIALRLLVAVAFPALVGSVWWMVRDRAGDGQLIDALAGCGGRAGRVRRPVQSAGNHGRLLVVGPEWALSGRPLAIVRGQPA